VIGSLRGHCAPLGGKWEDAHPDCGLRRCQVCYFSLPRLCNLVPFLILPSGRKYFVLYQPKAGQPPVSQLRRTRSGDGQSNSSFPCFGLQKRQPANTILERSSSKTDQVVRVLLMNVGTDMHRLCVRLPLVRAWSMLGTCLDDLSSSAHDLSVVAVPMVFR